MSPKIFSNLSISGSLNFLTSTCGSLQYISTNGHNFLPIHTTSSGSIFLIKIKSASKTSPRESLSVLRMIKSEIERLSKDKSSKTELEIIESYKKKLEKSISIKNVPEYFINKVKQEIEIVKQFLPEELTLQEAIDIAKENITNKSESSKTIVAVKKRAKELNKICPGRIAFLAVKEVLEDK